MENTRFVNSTLHNHLRTSSNVTKDTVVAAVKKAGERLGKGGIFGLIRFNPSKSEIDSRWEYFEEHLKNLCPVISTKNGYFLPAQDLLILHGQEIPTNQGHILLVGTPTNRTITNDSSIDDVLDFADQYNALKALDHPFHYQGLGPFLARNPEYIKRFDLIETQNGEASLWLPRYVNANKKGRAFHKDHPELAEFSSDDGHTIWELGRNYTQIPISVDYSTFKDSPEKLTGALRNGHKNPVHHRKSSAKFGTILHMANLGALIVASKFGLDANRDTAPALDKIGYKI